jgi:hypothetical protein
VALSPVHARPPVAACVYIKGIDVAGEVHLPIAGLNVDSSDRLGQWNQRNRHADGDRMLDSRFHKLPPFRFLGFFIGVET